MAEDEESTGESEGIENFSPETEENVYSEQGREEILADDEITPAEEGFMQGHEEASDFDGEKTAANPGYEEALDEEDDEDDDFGGDDDGDDADDDFFDEDEDEE